MIKIGKWENGEAEVLLDGKRIARVWADYSSGEYRWEVTRTTEGMLSMPFPGSEADNLQATLAFQKMVDLLGLMYHDHEIGRD